MHIVSYILDQNQLQRYIFGYAKARKTVKISNGREKIKGEALGQVSQGEVDSREGMERVVEMGGVRVVM